jgi:hypothetical protein
MWFDNCSISRLIGVTLRSVTRNGNESIDFESDGERWRMYYEPDCCATCTIEDVIGDLDDLVGSPIVMAEESTNSDSPKESEYADESFTWTFYKLATAKGYVTIRWYGSSNGYYSETASFRSLGLKAIEPVMGDAVSIALEVALHELAGFGRFRTETKAKA